MRVDAPIVWRYCSTERQRASRQRHLCKYACRTDHRTPTFALHLCASLTQHSSCLTEIQRKRLRVSRWLFQTAFFANLSRRIFAHPGENHNDNDMRLAHGDIHLPCITINFKLLVTRIDPSHRFPKSRGADPRKSIPHRGGGGVSFWG